jgi:hypothetical protein
MADIRDKDFIKMELYKSPLLEQNLEIEVFKMNITREGINRLKSQTAVEHDRLLGLFVSGQGRDLTGSSIKFNLNGQVIVSPDFIEFSILENTSFYGYRDATFPLNKEISASDFQIEFDNKDAGVPFDIYVYLICRKKQ